MNMSTSDLQLHPRDKIDRSRQDHESVLASNSISTSIHQKLFSTLIKKWLNCIIIVMSASLAPATCRDIHIMSYPFCAIQGTSQNSFCFEKKKWNSLFLSIHLKSMDGRVQDESADSWNARMENE